jgi:aryl-alcohol dehydrogenase-like predicted oxidoreductase
MQTRNFGRLGTISALTLGGGGIAGIWGDTARAEAIATVHAAIDAGITMLDVAPSYGPGHEAEQVVGAALRERPAPGVLVTSKVQLPDGEGDITARIDRSLHASLQRIGREHLDLLLLHTQIRPADDSAGAPDTIGWRTYREEVVPELERLRTAGLIRAWGITAVGHPAAVLGALREQARPDAAQVVVNALDLNGDMWAFGPEVPSANQEILQTANEHGVPVLGIRVVAAGSLTSAVDRDVTGQPAAADYARAESFRKLAAELGETPAALAHRYALSVPGVASVILGVKNRTELDECVAAEARGGLSEAELDAIAALRAPRR